MPYLTKGKKSKLWQIKTKDLKPILNGMIAPKSLDEKNISWIMKSIFSIEQENHIVVGFYVIRMIIFMTQRKWDIQANSDMASHVFYLNDSSLKYQLVQM